MMNSFNLLISIASLFSISLAWHTPLSSTPQVDLGYEIHQGWLNVTTDPIFPNGLQLNMLIENQETGGFYNFSNVRYAAPPLGNLRFAAPAAPSTISKVINNGSNFVVCPQGIPAWTSVAVDWLTNGLGAINITAGYTPPNITTLPPPMRGTSEDCLFLDILAPKSIFDNRGQGSGAPV